MSSGMKVAKAVLEHISKSNGFGQCLKKVEIVSAGGGNCTAKLVVSEEHLNAAGSLHGGFTSTLIDCISTYALMTNERAAPGVSVDLHVTFMKAAFPGDTVTVDARTVRAGNKLAFLAVDVTKNDGKDMIAHGRHTKYMA